MLRESAKFFGAFLRSPNGVGSVIPSSRYLAGDICTHVDLQPGHRILELGAGTGPITKVIVARTGLEKLLAFEPDADIAAICRENVPGVDLREEYVGPDLPTKLPEAWGAQVDRIVSGLPFTAWPEDVMDNVLDGVVSTLTDDGRFATYTYSWRRHSLGGQRLREGLKQRFHNVWEAPTTWANFPPANVLVAERPKR